MRPSLLLLAAFALATLAPRAARAADPPDALEELKRGYALKQGGDCRAAIPHFAASHRLAPSAKALLNLADCELRVGDLAAARAHAEEGGALARRQQDAELTAVADTQLAAIDEKQPRVAPKPPVAPGPSPASPPPAPPPVVPPPAAEGRDGSGQRTIAYVLGGAGLAGIAAGSVFGLVAISKNGSSNADGHCDATGCDPAGKQLRQDALSAATASTVAFGVGLAALAAGVVVYLTAPDGVHVGPAVGASYGGLVLGGHWW